mgnify:CR=1 FL=1
MLNSNETINEMCGSSEDALDHALDVSVNDLEWFEWNTTGVFAVLKPSKIRFHIGYATTLMFAITALAHAIGALDMPLFKDYFLFMLSSKSKRMAEAMKVSPRISPHPQTTTKVDTKVKEDERGLAPLRWIEYMMTAPLMFSILLVMAGSRSIQNVLNGVILMFLTISLGFITDILGSMNLNSLKLVTFLFAWVPYSTAWYVPIPIHGISLLALYVILTHVTTRRYLLYSLFTNTLDDVKNAGYEVDDAVPSYILITLWILFILFTSFAIVQFYFQFISHKNHFWRSEVFYVLLSLTAKVILGSVLLVQVIMKSSCSL